MLTVHNAFAATHLTWNPSWAYLYGWLAMPLSRLSGLFGLSGVTFFGTLCPRCPCDSRSHADDIGSQPALLVFLLTDIHVDVLGVYCPPDPVR